MANMGGTWLAIVFGFAGVRIKESGISFDPTLPEEWDSLEFHLQYQDCLIKVLMEENIVTYLLEEGDKLVIVHQGKEIELKRGVEVTK